MKTFLCAIMAGSVALSAAFAQTPIPKAQMTGTVVAITPKAITVQRANEPGWVWDIQKGDNTKITPAHPKVGSQATVNYNVPDAQKKEAPTTQPTATPAQQ